MVELANQVILHVKADDDLNSISKEAIIENRGLSSLPYGFSLRADGGSNWNIKNTSVQIALVYFFLHCDLDLLVYIVTAVDILHVNEAIGVMPVANLALQNQAFARNAMSPFLRDFSRGPTLVK